MAGRRADVLIATKWGHTSSLADGERGGDPARIRSSLEASLQRLGTDYVDHYQLHRPDPETPQEDTLGALEELRLEGKIREIGCTYFSAAELADAERAGAAIGVPSYPSVQNQYSLLTRTPETDGVLDTCEQSGIAFVPFFPLESGLLTGKYRLGEELPAGTRLAAWGERGSRFIDDDRLRTVAALTAFAEGRGRSMLELAMSWLVSNPLVATVIAGRDEARASRRQRRRVGVGPVRPRNGPRSTPSPRRREAIGPGIVTMAVVQITWTQHRDVGADLWVRLARPIHGAEHAMTSFDLDLTKYNLGWSDEVEYAFDPVKGINEGVVDQISWWKGEPRWMTQFRKRSLRQFDRKPMAEWFATNMPDLDFQDIYYYLKPSGEQVNEWDELPEQMKVTYEKLGIPEAERKYLAGVTAQYESEVVYHKNREDLAAQGILFCDMDTALREYPDLVKQYFGTIIPPGDNKFAALNSSVWSGGSFVYVPPGVNCEMPLQAYFRINSENAGQFERTLIIADEGSQVHYIEGCSAPVYTSDSLHSAVVEIVVKPSARVTYTTIQNWSPNVYNLVTKRARVEAEGHMEWIDGNIGSKLTMKYPSVYLVGPKATGEVLSVAYAGAGQHQDAGAKMIHAAPETTSKIVSKSISKDGGKTTYRGLVRVEEGATKCKSHVQCDALILDEDSVSKTLPYMEVGERDAEIGHEATVSKIADEQIFYLQSRGLSEEQAMGMVVNGFIEPITRTLPMEYAVEWSRLIELQMEGSVG